MATASAFLAFTGHWIDSQWKHKSCLLGFIDFPSPYSALHAFELIWDTLKSYGIENKVGAFVTDNTGSASKFQHRGSS
ncbi:unnamed protein product [Tilletia controversa]|uniref:DUF659 domain-containing protein n=2 Tax=Tilletia TaxID=13289 RepID=A0A177T0T8_9BASI|nr:hypothetical protein CF336_g8206 [Tilletia laevis]KAE8183817.1 hypothetical protein CF328_g8062 [Tilletia controversa]KAE8235956.1 hypothetical protein A4X03_0g9598 [Tilletia caries]KAE8192949.1 hypothetical protein CF335_g5712 [Tilletia laevis]CAD6913117.1 unnamed protein product [Tilletia controversa]